MFVRGQELRIFVTGVSKDGRLCSLWVQTDFDSFAELDELIQQIDANDRVTFKPVAVNGINVGDVVIAKYNEDGMWYRAHILEKASGKCKVFFMDYGNEETVSVSDMIYGPEQYFNIPPLATKFIFADFQAADEQELTDDEMTALQEHLQNIDGKGQILHEGSSGIPPTLRVFEENLPQVPIAHTLIQNGCGIMYENDHFRFANIPRAAMSPGKAQNVYVSHTDSAVKFCLQLVSEEAILQDLEEKLEEIVPNLGPIPMQHIKKGAVCIANFEDAYYRGVVSTVDNALKTAIVYFIDYGNSAEVPLPEVLYLPEEYCVLPAQAIECSLKGSAVNSTDFSKLIDSETVYARVLQVLESGLHIVDLSNNASSRQASQEQVPSSRPSVNTVITSYPAMSLEEDVLLDVCISHVEENDRFYCQLLGNAKALDSLMCAIQDADLVPLKGAIREGTCCLARSPSDGVIYRAQMLSGSVAGPHVKYVDFGVTETVQPSSLYVLPSDLADIPARAVCCSLSDSSDLTSTQVKETLNKYHSKKPLIAEVACKTPKSYEVVLYDTSVSDEPLVSMIRSNQSRPAASTQKISQSPALASGTLQPPNITLGKPFAVIGSLALKPTVFFAQVASFPVEDLESLSEGLHAFYSNNNVPSLSNCSAGDVCVTEFSEDGAHYRARVKARRDDLALVSFVDYGNQEKKNISELKVIAPQFCQVPVAGALFDLGKYYDVIDPDQLAAAIVEQELTVMCDGQSKDGYTCKLPQMECNMAILPLLRRKDAEAAPPPAQTRPAANPTPRMREKQKIVELGADVVRGRQQVLVAYAEDPEHLSLQLVSQKPALDAMMDAMGDFCNSAPVTHLQVALTDCVIAKYSEDGEWYRATVTGLKSGGQQYEVYFVDYGNYDTVSLSDLREIPANFTTLPAQAVRCSLNGIAPEFAGTPWDTEQNERLCEALLEVELTADFVDHSPGSNTFTVDLLSSDGANFNRSFLQSCGRLSRKYGGGESGHQRHAPPPQAHVAPQPAAEDTKIIPFKQIAVDEYMDVVVPYGLGIDNFNCQVTSDVAELDQMQEAIAQDYAAPGNPLPRPAPGQFCCALYAEDEVWYRAQIQAVSGHTATVHFVDYGNVESVDVRSLRALKDKYYQLPRQAIQCELFGVEPVGAEWSEEANNTFLEMATSQDSIVACPVLKKSDGVYVFELVAGTDPANSVPYHEKLIKDGYAKACALPQQTPTNAPLPDRPSKAQQPITLVNNQPVDVYIAHVDSVSRIYCQLLSEAPKLEEVMANLAENYSNLGPSEMRLKNAGVGVVCAAKYSEDGEWYRGEILSVAPQQYHIRFVDYGNEEWVGSDEVRMLTKQLLSLPPQAIPVSLDGVTVRPGQEDAAKAIIEQHIEDTVKVVPHSRSRDGVHLAAISVNGASLADLLVQARVASAPAGPVARPSPVAPTPVAQPPRGPQPIVGKYQINRALEPGCQYEVLISWVESPLEFYCQYCESEDILVTMAEKLKAEYDHLKLSEMCLPSLPTGTACVAYYEEDGNWYRGTVLKVRGQQAMVKYIDYGNRSKVALSKVKAPSSELIEQEMEAVQCSLKGVSAPAGGEWPEAVIALFQELSAVQPRLKVIDLEGDHYVVDLITKDCRSIAERIVNLMQPKKGGWSNNRASVEGSQNGGGGRYGDRQQKYGASNESGAGDRSQYDNRRNTDYGSSRPVGGSDGGWGDRRNKDAGRPQDDGYRSNKSNFGGNAESRNNRDNKPAPVPSAPFAATAPREKLAYPECVLMSGVTDCYIASVSTPLKFYIQYVSQEDELADFANKVSSEYSSLRPGERAVTSTAVDEPCCALFSDDAWYRARIIGVQGAQVTVLFVDYGNSETVNLSEVRCLTPELARTPPYAIECKLKDMNQYTDEDLAKLNALAAEESFKVQFLGASVPCEVAMWLGEENLLDVLPSGRQSAAIPEIPATGAIQDYPPLPKPAPGAAYVSHIVSPGEFYLQFAEHEDQLEELVVETAPPTPVLQQSVVGSACAAQFSEDDAWYRARIVAVNGPTATVQFVDHGNCEEVDVATLQQIHNATTPPVCVQCKLGPEKMWSEDEKEKFSELVLEKQLHVDLQGEAPPYIAIVTDQETGKVINEEFTAPEAPVSAPSASAASASTASASDFEYPPLDFSTFVGRIPVYVSHVDSPGKFYIQPVSVEDDLSTMLERLEEQYGEGGRPVQNPRVDMACCAKFTEDDVLYRARIVAIEDGAVTVQFVDYGNCDTPPAEQIYEMAPDTPPMAVQCSLTALAQPPGGWSDDINAKLLELTEDKVITAEFHATGATCEVSLYEGEQNIGDLLRAEFTQIESTTPAGATASEMEPEPVAASSVEEEPPTDSAPEAAAASAESSPGEKHKGGRRRRLSRLPCPLEPVEAYISAVSSPGNFYVQPMYVDDDVAAMEAKLSALYSAGGEPLDNPEAGQICCAQASDDGEYYRALITSIGEGGDENMAEVLYVDYGNSEMQRLDSLKKLDESVLGQPVMTLICGLAGIEGEEWSQEETTKFMEETEEKRVTIVFKSFKEPYNVTVLERSEDVAKRLFTYRLKTGEDTPATSQPEAAVAQTDEVDAEEVQPVAAPVTDQPPTAEQEAVEEITNDEEDEQEADQEVPSAAPSAAPCLLPVRERVAVTVSWVTSPSQFYVQLADNEDALAELEERLHEFYEEEDDGKIPESIHPGLVCAAKYASEEEEEKWYRAEVVSVDNDTVTVFFLDWGNSESIPTSSLRPLAQDFLSLPHQCVKCSLSNVQPITDEWPDEAATWFEETVTECESLQCRALHKTTDTDADDLWEVELFDEAQQSLAATMKHKGYAIEITEDEQEQESMFATTIPTEALDRNSKVQVSVSHVESPDSFWVQVKPNPVLEQLEDDMSAFYSASSPPVASDVAVGNCYAIRGPKDDKEKEDAKEEEEEEDVVEVTWDRVRVVALASGFVTVRYVDYGYEDDVPAARLFPLRAGLASVPAQCRACRLLGVAPITDQEEEREKAWTADATDLLRELTMGKCLLLQIVDEDSDGKYGCRLLDMGVPVAQMLADNAVARLIDVPSQPSKADESLASLASDLSEGVQDYVDGLIAGAKAILQAESSRDQSREAPELLEVTYLHGDGPDNFYVQLAPTNDEFRKLEDSLEETFQVAEQDPSVELTEDENILVQADEQYYRASVLQVQDEQVEVSLVDYGGSRTVGKEACRALGAVARERLFSVPSQCMACRLEGIEAAQWTQQAIEFFQGLVQGERLCVRILSQTADELYSVYMYVLRGEEKDEEEQDPASSVNMQLVQAGHATVVPGCQLDIDLDLEADDNALQECSFLEETKLHSNSIGSLHDESLYTPGTKETALLSPLQYSVGAEVRMRVSAVTDPDNIVLIDCTDTDTFTVLSQQMHDYYNDASSEAGVITSPQPGQSAAVLINSTWQRCQVVKVEDDQDEDGGAVEVLLVDTGLQHSLPATDLRELDQRFSTLPTQACRMCLDTDSQHWPEDVRTKLEEACGVGQEDNFVTVTITSDTDGFTAKIVNKDGVELSSLCRADGSPEFTTPEPEAQGSDVAEGGEESEPEQEEDNSQDDSQLTKPIPQPEGKTERAGKCEMMSLAEEEEDKNEEEDDQKEELSGDFEDENNLEEGKEQNEESGDEDIVDLSAQGNELVDAMDISTKSLKEEMEEIALELIDVVANADDDVELHDEGSVISCEIDKDDVECLEEEDEVDKRESNVEDTEDKDDFEEKFEEDEYDVKTVEEMYKDAEDLCDEEFEESPEVLSSSGVTKPIDDDSAADMQAEPGDEVTVESDRLEMPQYANGEAIAQESDGRKSAEGKDVQDESSGGSILMHDVEDLVSNEEDSREYTDSGHVTTDKSQCASYSSIEAEDFHDLEGTRLREDAEVHVLEEMEEEEEATVDDLEGREEGQKDAEMHSGCDVSAGCPEEDIMQVEKGDGDAARPLKHQTPMVDSAAIV